MATTLARPPSGRLDHRELRRFLGALRIQLWWRDALAIAAACAVAGALLGAAVLVWPVGPAWSGSDPIVAVWLMLAAIALGALVAGLRRPTVIHAARVADRQLSTASRLATAAEVLDGRLGGNLAPAQLEDAWRLASRVRPWKAFPYAWRRVQVALLAIGLSVVLLGIALSGVLTPVYVPGLIGSSGDTATGADLSQAAEASTAADAADALTADPSTNPAAAAQTLEQLQAAAAQSQANEAALQKLGDALRGTSAARDVGDAIRSGNYDDAATKMVALGRDADQLSRFSKRELSNAMQRVAYDTAKVDPALALAENAVSRGLNRQEYADTKSALENLAKTITDTKNGVVSQEALAKSLDQLQQQQGTPPGGGGGDSADYIPDIPGTEPQQVGLVKGQTSTISVPGPEGDPKKADRSGVGLNPGGDPLGDITSRLSLPPVDISVDAQLSNDRGRDKANPAAPTVKISDTSQNGVQSSNVVQPGDPGRDVAEQTIEPTAGRDTVRSFFKSATDGTPSQHP